MLGRILTAMGATALLAVTPVLAQMPGSEVPPVADNTGGASAQMTPADNAKTYGVSGWSVANVAPVELQAYNQGLNYIFWSGGYVGPRTGDTFRYFDAPVHIPTGALVYGYTPFFYDNSNTGYVRLYVWQEACAGNVACALTTVVDYQTDTVGTPGYTASYHAFPSAITWQNWAGAAVVYSHLRVYFSEDGSTLRMGPVTFWYKRQVSPAPGSATFSDVPTNYWAFQYVEALAASGITSGCGGGNFCPTQAVTRDQMAVFLSKALGLHWPDL